MWYDPNFAGGTRENVVVSALVNGADGVVTSGHNAASQPQHCILPYTAIVHLTPTVPPY